MNSKQLNFFLSPDDLPLVYDFFIRMELKYVRVNKYDPDDINFESFPFRHGSAHEQIFITRMDFSSQIHVRRNEAASEYCIDLEKSLVLQFTPGGIYPFNSRIINRGSFYCTTSYFVSNGESVGKPDEFKKWVDKLFKSFKKEFLLTKLDERFGIYISHRGSEWMKDTGAVVDRTFERIFF
jgi:hypothetical protein